jgi:pseudouridine-5'-phosphate glycosidase
LKAHDIAIAKASPRIEPITIAPDVNAALLEGRPVVALESTIVAHGMPYPSNVAAASRIETIVRDHGAVPATIAVMGGAIRIGIDADAIEELALARDVMKVSRADLAYAIATKRRGATTVAATMICAARAGIPVFATGGIGGVHRGVEASLDISADLEELARTPVTVVCAGAKAILDLPRTFEYLETRGVPVIAYRSDAIPAFWSRDSGIAATQRLDTAAAIAVMLRTHRLLGLGGGVLVANPIPAAEEIPAAEIMRHIDAALADAARENITGKAVTPYLLRQVLASTGGRSLASNIALVENNAALAADIAQALAE